MRKLFTSESVTEGHPDKICDKISDAVLDYIISFDANARVACEVAVTSDFVLVTGEITTKIDYDLKGLIEYIAREAIKDIGYTDPALGFCYNTCKIEVLVNKQSPDIALGVDVDGAGDQGTMFGYATNETEDFMPLTISLAHKLTKKLTEVRKNNILPYLRPDGKSQVTVEYDNGKPVRVDTIVISSQHTEEVENAELIKGITEEVIKKVVPAEYIDKNTKIYINPTGRFVLGGPTGDSGLTGRKIIVDTYGGVGRHGGGAFSGKDPTKVDRSGAYIARYIAKNLVASGVADKIEIQLAYAIGVNKPVSIYVDTFGTGKVRDGKIIDAIVNIFDLSPKGIIENLRLKTPIYRSTTNYGHFGKEFLPWEQTDLKHVINSWMEL